MTFLLQLAKMAALAAFVALLAVAWLSPPHAALLGVGVFYLLLVRVS